MIINEKQIMQLLQYAQSYCDLLCRLQNDKHTEYSKQIDILILQITKQQSEELNVIE